MKEDNEIEEMNLNKQKDIKEDSTGDQYELVRSVIDTYTMDKTITKNWTLANLTPEEDKFCRQQFLLAKIIREFIKDPEYAQKTYALLMAEVEVLLVRSRNKKTNTILMGVLGKVKETDETEHKKNILEKFAGKLFPNKNEEKEEEE